MIKKPLKRSRLGTKILPPVAPAQMDEETPIKHYLRLAVQVDSISLLFTLDPFY